MIVYIAIGSNLGDARNEVVTAVRALSQEPGLSLLAESPLFRSKPHLATGDDYVNAVISMQCELSAFKLLETTQRIENSQGRVRSFINAPRTLDLDLIFYGDEKIDSPKLTIPHPRWSERAFVLLPLQCIAPHLVSADMLELVKTQPIFKLE